jgi:hypothetical protein
LNKLVGRMGSPSDFGISYPGGGAPSVGLEWRWWVTDAHFTLTTGIITFTATVHSSVGGQESEETRTVPASVIFTAASSRVRLVLGPFTVPVQAAGVTVAQVDIAKLYGISLPIEPQTFTLPLPGGGTRTVTARAVGVTSQVFPDRLVLTVSVGF